MKKIIFYFERLSFWLAIKILILKGIRKLFGLNFEFAYAQFGEDLVLSELFGKNTDIFYVDVGCNHPIKYSNTFLMYLKGGQGLVIDGNEIHINHFAKYRPNDIAIHAYLSDKEEAKTYFKFEDDLTNTLDADFAKEWSKNNKIVEEKSVKTTTLNLMLNSALKEGQNIDFLNIDLEGMDHKIISSLDFNKYRPSVIAIEIHDMGFGEVEDKTYKLIVSKGYKLVSFLHFTAIFVDIQSKYNIEN